MNTLNLIVLQVVLAACVPARAGGETLNNEKAVINVRGRSSTPPNVALEVMDDLKDALAAPSCDQAAGAVDRMERSILDIKTRFLALQLKRGAKLSDFKNFPGSDITDPDLKQEFYDRIRAWYKKDQIPELSAPEFQRLLAVDVKAIMLFKDCSSIRQ